MDVSARIPKEKRPHVERKLQQHLSKLYSSEFGGVNKLEEVNPLIAVLRMVKVEYSAQQPQLYKMLVAVLYDYNPALGAQHYLNTKRYVSILLEDLPQLAQYINSILPTPVCSATQPSNSLHVLGKPKCIPNSNNAPKCKDQIRENGNSSHTKASSFTYMACQGVSRSSSATTPETVKSLPSFSTMHTTEGRNPSGVVKKISPNTVQNSIDQEFIQKMKASGQGITGGTSGPDSKMIMSNTRIRNKFSYGQEMIVSDKRSICVAKNSQLEQRIREFVANKARMMGRNGQLLDKHRIIAAGLEKRHNSTQDATISPPEQELPQLMAQQVNQGCTQQNPAPLKCLQNLVNSIIGSGAVRRSEDVGQYSGAKASVASHPLLYIGSRSSVGQIAAVTVVSVRPTSNTPLYVVSPSSTTVASVITTGPYQTTHTTQFMPQLPLSSASVHSRKQEHVEQKGNNQGEDEEDSEQDADIVEGSIRVISALTQDDQGGDDDVSSQGSYVDVDGDVDMDVPGQTSRAKVDSANVRPSGQDADSITPIQTLKRKCELQTDGSQKQPKIHSC